MFTHLCASVVSLIGHAADNVSLGISRLAAECHRLETNPCDIIPCEACNASTGDICSALLFLRGFSVAWDHSQRFPAFSIFPATVQTRANILPATVTRANILSLLVDPASRDIE